MALKVFKTANSIRIASIDNSIIVARVNGELRVEQSIVPGRDMKAAMNASTELKNVLRNKIDKKMNYQKRFAKVVSMIEEMGEVKSFAVLKNKLSAVA